MTDTPRILVADSEPVSRRFLELALRAAGYSVVARDHGAGALRELEQKGGVFDCAIVEIGREQFQSRRADSRAWDSRQGAARLLACLKHADPALALIATGAAAGKAENYELESLRAGAVEFLLKPLRRDRLTEAAAAAIAITESSRRSLRIHQKVGAVGAMQRALTGTFGRGGANAVEFYFRPLESASGDSLRHYHLSGSREVLLLTDVSGHQYDSAVVSAFVDGVMRALLEGEIPIEEVLVRCNRLLLTGRGVEEGRFSVTAVCIELDHDRAATSLILAGGIPPVWAGADGWLESFRSPESSPLGWFSEEQPVVMHGPLPSGPFWVWSDGVSSLAAMRGVDPLAMVSALLQAEAEGKTPKWTSSANDDLLAARFLSERITPESGILLEPVVAARYNSADAGAIDRIQDLWRRSLELVAPGVASHVIFDVMLASREAVLNALRHGCVSGGETRFQMVHDRASGVILVRVQDSGGGYTESGPQGDGDLPDGHRGLLLIRHLVSSLTFSKSGACVTMTFRYRERNS